ncbi:hypothetical protein Tco_0420571 [Tanacetum coccineum]
MIDQDKIMVAPGGNITWKNPQESYDLIKNKTQHHYQWDSEVQYDTTTDMSAHYFKTTFTSSEQVEVNGNDIGYTFQMLKVQKSIHLLSGSHNPSSNSIVASPSPSLTLLENTKNSEINSLIRGPSDTFLTGNKEIEFSPLKDIDDPIPIPRVFEKPLDFLDLISETFKMTIINPLFDFDSKFTLNSDNHIFDIQNAESDESETETIMEEVQIHSSQSTAQIPPPYRKYGYIKNHKKTVKNGQARTRESEEYKKKPKNQSRSQKSQASVKISQEKSKCPHNDQTATIEAPMIRRNDWLGLKDWRARQEARRIQGRL